MSPARPDSLVSEDIGRALRTARDLEAGEILFGLRDGVVTLSGDVPEASMKALAERIVAGVAGVVEVRNLLNIDDGTASFGPPGQAVRGAAHEGGPGSIAERDLDEDG